MEDRLAVRDAPRMGYGGGPAAVDDSEEEKVYYGFGVFMGLPLADLRAMKEEYLQNQTQGGQPQRAPAMAPPQRAPRGRPSDNGAARPMMESELPMRGPPRGGAPPGYGDYGEYEMRDPMGRSHGMVRGDRAPPAMPRDVDPRMLNGRGAMMPPQYAGGAMRMPPGRRGAAYDASVDGVGGANGGGRHHAPHPDEDGESSDGSYSAPKSHSLNFILH